MCNLTSGGSAEQIIVLCQHGVLKPFTDLLSVKDDKTVAVVLDGLSNILSLAEKFGEVEKVSSMIEECGGLDKIEDLQHHENEILYKKSLSIIEKYFGEDEEDNGVVVPAASAEAFEFTHSTDGPSNTQSPFSF